MESARHVKLYFLNNNEPLLAKVGFQHPLVGVPEILSVRGKTGGVYDTHRTFQWTSAVQALVLVLLRTHTYSAKTFGSEIPLTGGPGSLAASLSYALDKQPVWLVDMFGIASNGVPVIKRLLKRSTVGGRKNGQIAFSLNKNTLVPSDIRVYLDEVPVDTIAAVANLLESLEQSLGIESSYNTNLVPLLNSKDNSKIRPTTSALEMHPVFKTPRMLSHISAGPVHTRVYEDGNTMALVVTYGRPVEIRSGKEVFVRIQYHCSLASAIHTTDCDCDSQHQEALAVLENEGGVLIYLYAPNSTNQLFARYFELINRAPDTMYTCFGYTLDEDLRRDEVKMLSIVPTILADIGIKNLALLTNNPDKIEVLKNADFGVSTYPLVGKLTPQNFGHIYGKFKFGNHRLNTTFETSADRFLCSSITPHQDLSQRKAWIFAGEDTIWEDNIYYEDQIRQFIDWALSYTPNLSRFQLRSLIDEISRNNIQQLGFGPEVFTQTLINAYEKIRTNNNSSIPYPKEFLADVAKRINESPIQVSPDAETLLYSLKNNNVILVLLVQGPLTVQVNKVARLHIAHFFDVIAIVPCKTTEVFSSLIDDLLLERSQVTVIGNNLESEISPATRLGIRTFFYNNPNSWTVLNSSEIDPTLYEEVHSLRNLGNRAQDHSIEAGSTKLLANDRSGAKR